MFKDHDNICVMLLPWVKPEVGKIPQKWGPIYHFVLGPLFWECPLPWGLALHTWKMKKKKRKKCIFKNSKNFNLENIKNQEYYVTNSLFSLKNIGQTFEKSFNFWTKIIHKFMRYVFYTLKK